MTANRGLTETFPSFPQPETFPTPTPSAGIYDPYGLLYTLTANLVAGTELNSWFSESAFELCTYDCAFTNGPQPALSTAFMYQGSTTYEGRSEAAVTSSTDSSSTSRESPSGSSMSTSDSISAAQSASQTGEGSSNQNSAAERLQKSQLVYIPGVVMAIVAVV